MRSLQKSFIAFSIVLLALSFGVPRANCDPLSELTFKAQNGSTLVGTSVPTNNSFAYAIQDGDLPKASGAGSVLFQAASFPPDQVVVLYDMPYGLGPNDIGGSNSASDVLSGNWPAVATHFVSLQVQANQTVTAQTNVLSPGVEHAIRYVRGTCRVSIPLAPVFISIQRQFIQQTQNLPWYASLDNFFQFAQPQFRRQLSS